MSPDPDSQASDDESAPAEIALEELDDVAGGMENSSPPSGQRPWYTLLPY